MPSVLAGRSMLIAHAGRLSDRQNHHKTRKTPGRDTEETTRTRQHRIWDQAKVRRSQARRLARDGPVERPECTRQARAGRRAAIGLPRMQDEGQPGDLAAAGAQVSVRFP